MPRPRPFDFQINNHGARIEVTRTPLHSACLTDDEVDNQIDNLKRELDSLAAEMKQAIIKQREKPPFGKHNA